MTGNESGTPILALEDVRREYGDGRVHALNGVSLTIERGECVAIMGPSGSGKSTLLHVLSGLDRPTSGQALFEGRAPSSGEWVRLRAARMGFVFQAFHLLPTLTAAENVEVPMFGTGRPRRAREERARELLHGVGLADRATHLPRQLSGGECQRVAIARALANDPDVLLADEPTGNLDSASSAEVLDLIFGIHARERTTLLLVTHEPAVADRAGRIVHLLDGRLVPDPSGAPAPCAS
jgi:putative ABC transport system ATP-binding protein